MNLYRDNKFKASLTKFGKKNVASKKRNNFQNLNANNAITQKKRFSEDISTLGTNENKSVTLRC